MALDIIGQVIEAVGEVILFGADERTWLNRPSHLIVLILWLWLLFGPFAFGCDLATYPYWLAFTVPLGLIVSGLSLLVNGARAFGHLVLAGIIVLCWHLFPVELPGDTSAFLLINAGFLAVSALVLAFAGPRDSIT